jgi:hypothetical protein
MYKYTPEPKLLKTLQLAKAKRYWKGDSPTWTLASSYFSDYTDICNFLRGWENVVFYSPTRRQEIPVVSSMFPVSFFQEEKV